MRTAVAEEFRQKEYIKGGEFTEEEIRDLLKIRLHMIDTKENYRNGINAICQFCNNKEETTEHVLTECQSIRYLRRDLEIKENKLNLLSTIETKAMIEMNRRVNLIMISSRT